MSSKKILIDEINKKCNEENIKLPFSENTNILNKELIINGKRVPNRLAIQPMEGCDGEKNGAISELCHRRYLKFAKSQAGLIWFEATAVVPEGRANPLQLHINDKTADSFKRLVEEIKEISLKENGFEPIIICQLTHSGRHSKPNGKPEQLTAYKNPIFEKASGVYDPLILDDDYLDALPEKFANAAILSQECGFDGVDVKCCHGYLFNEFLSAYTRENSKYGGSFENRTRLFLNSVDAVKSQVKSDLIVTSRLNVYDGFEYPFGFGTKENEGLTPCLDEPKKLIKILKEKYGYELLNITIGNPYVNPHVNRPFNVGPYPSPENPLSGVERMLNCTKEIKEEFKDLNILCSALSNLGKYSPYLASGVLEQNYCDIAGFGRMALAYPEFAKDILNDNFNDKKICLTCSKCSALMRAGSVAGCVIRDTEMYLPKYKEFVK